MYRTAWHVLCVFHYHVLAVVVAFLLDVCLALRAPFLHASLTLRTRIFYLTRAPSNRASNPCRLPAACNGYQQSNPKGRKRAAANRVEFSPSFDCLPLLARDELVPRAAERHKQLNAPSATPTCTCPSVGHSHLHVHLGADFTRARRAGRGFGSEGSEVLTRRAAVGQRYLRPACAPP